MTAHVCYSCQREVFPDEILSTGRHDSCGARVKAIGEGKAPSWVQLHGVKVGVAFLVGLSVGAGVAAW